MKTLTREQLKEDLLKLREKRVDPKYFYIKEQKPGIMCYSPAEPKYRPGIYIGNHTCNTCGKKFGMDLQERIKQCQKEQYEAYLESKDENLVVPANRCFQTFLKDYCEFNELEQSKQSKSLTKKELNNSDHLKQCHYKEFKKTLKYLSECNLKITSSDYASENSASYGSLYFNRKLTFDEWCRLNSDCCIDCNKCFEYATPYSNFEKLAQEYIKNGYDVLLKYNCNKCINSDLHAPRLEFWFKLEKDKEYIVSYIHDRGDPMSQKIEYMDYKDYTIALEFLKGHKEYEYLISKFSVDRVSIDRALHNILGLKIEYTKDEIISSVHHSFSPQAVKLMESIFSKYGNDFKLSASKYNRIINVFQYKNMEHGRINKQDFDDAYNKVINIIEE